MSDKAKYLFFVLSVITILFYLVRSRRYKLSSVVFVVSVLLADFYYTFKVDKLVLHNHSQQTKYKPVRKSNVYTKKIHVVHMKDFTNFDWKYIREHTRNLTIPCVFQFENSERFNQILTKVKNEIVNKKLMVQDKITSIYYEINYNEYNPRKHRIWNQTFEKSLEHLGLPYVLYSNYFSYNKNGVTGFHNEISSTLNVQLQGKKEWIMVDPAESDLLYPVKSRFGNHVTKFGHQRVNQDILKSIPHYKHIMSENQILFVPSWWWHQVCTLEDNTESLSMRTVPPFSMFNKYFLPKSISSIFLSVYVSLFYNPDTKNIYGYELNKLTNSSPTIQV